MKTERGGHTGEWSDDLYNGVGKYYYANGDIYEGGWAEGQKSGDGRYYFKVSETNSSASHRFRGDHSTDLLGLCRRVEARLKAFGKKIALCQANGYTKMAQRTKALLKIVLQVV